MISSKRGYPIRPLLLLATSSVMMRIIIVVLCFFAFAAAAACPNEYECGGEIAGICVNGTCECEPEYAGGDCQIKRKTKLAAFVLSIVLGVLGADRFYLGYYGLGLFKLVLPWTAIGGCCSAMADASDTKEMFGSCVAFLSCGTFICWWAMDWILIVMDELTDVNGVTLFNNM